MKNIDHLKNFIALNKPENLLIHSIATTRLWLICQKITKDQWVFQLMDPTKNIVFNLGIADNQRHLDLWNELIALKLESKIKQVDLAKKFRKDIYNYLKKYAR